MTDLTHDHTFILDLLPAYALDALDEEEAAQVASHLADCAGCRAELRAYQEVTVALTLAAATPVSAPPALEQRLMQRVRQAERAPRAPRAAPRPSLLERWLSSQAFRIAVPAVALIALIVAVALVAQPARAPIRWVMWGAEAAEEARGTLTISSGKNAVLAVSELPPLEESQQYQLWLIQPDGARDSGAVFSVEPDGSATVNLRLPRSADAYIGCGITVEPAGGSPQPTGPRVMSSDW